MAKGKKTGGRKPGSVNKMTANVKAALEEAFDQLGGVRSLVQWGEDNRSAFYTIWARLLPSEVKVDSFERRHVTVVRRVVTRRDDGGGTPLGPG